MSEEKKTNVEPWEEDDDRRLDENVLMRLQCEEVKNYAELFPEEEKENRMVEWISKYALDYRENMDVIKRFVQNKLKKNQE